MLCSFFLKSILKVWYIILCIKMEYKYARLRRIRGWVLSGLSPSWDQVILGLSPFRVESLRGWAPSGLSPLGVESIRSWVHSGLSPFEVESILGWVHSGFSPSGLGLFGVGFIWGSVHSGLSLSGSVILGSVVLGSVDESKDGASNEQLGAVGGSENA